MYEARHARLAGRYAVKVLHPEVRKHPEVLMRFQREAQVTSALRHPGIVQVIDFNTAPGGAPYLVMEYLEGEDLGRIIARIGTLALPRAANITLQIAAALSAAHRMGVVHRDLKPQNIFLLPGDDDEPERVKVLDFGISKIHSVSRKLTGTSVVLGTPQFMAPEQAEGREEVDAAADQFSLAAIVYEMLTGRPAFTGETLASVLYQIVHVDPVPVIRLRPDLPEDVQGVLARAFAKKKDERFSSALEFARRLAQAASMPVGITAPSTAMAGATVVTAAAPDADTDAGVDMGHDFLGAQAGRPFPFSAPPFRRLTGDMFRLLEVFRSPRARWFAAAAGAALVLVVVLTIAVSGRSESRLVAPAPTGATAQAVPPRSAGDRREPVRPTVQPLPRVEAPGAALLPSGGGAQPGRQSSASAREAPAAVEFELASDPTGLAVWVDDQPFPGAVNQAVTRMRGSLPPGVHTFSLTKAGYEPWRKQVDLKAHAPNRFLARMKKVQIRQSSSIS